MAWIIEPTPEFDAWFDKLTQSDQRILYAFDQRRQAVLLLGGDKAGQWTRWYDKNVRKADQLFAEHTERLRQDQQSTQPGEGKKKTQSRGRRKN